MKMGQYKAIICCGGNMGMSLDYVNFQCYAYDKSSPPKFDASFSCNLSAIKRGNWLFET
ncbi:hypothetical protein LguiA_036730 [Lonicera macranthoides]